MTGKNIIMNLSWNIYRQLFYRFSITDKLIITFMVFALFQYLFIKVSSTIGFSGMYFYSFMALVMGLNVAFAIIYAHNLTRPINELLSDLKIINSGNYSHKIKAEVLNDEIGELVDVNTQMVGAITSSLAETNGIVQGLGGYFRVIDRDFNVIKANPSMAEVTGTGPGENIKCFDQLKGPACHTENCTLKKILGGNKEIRAELEKTTPLGRTIPMEVTATPLKGESGNIVGVIELFIDISEKKEKENEIISLKNEINSRVEKLLPAVEAASKGDLTIQIEDNKGDSFAKLVNAFNEMRMSLRLLVTDIIGAMDTLSQSAQGIATSAEEMNSTTEQVSSTIQEIAHGAQNQSHQIEKGSMEIKNLTGKVKEISGVSDDIIDTISLVEMVSSKGGEAAVNANAKMQAINEVTNVSAENVKTLGERSKEISKIVDVISNIAEQTNLLALNAAIEAARAGEHGKGFAVVAEEVRKLAEDSSRAADRISSMILEINQDVSMAVEAMDAGRVEIESSGEIINEALNALRGVSDAVQEVSNNVKDIVKIAEEQQNISEKVEGTMEIIASTAQTAAAGSQEASASTEEQTASMEELTATTQELAKLAVDLQKTIEKFKL